MFEGRNNEPGSAVPSRVPSDAPTIGGGRYAVVAKIAEGGMAGVYRGWDAKLKVWRAIKVLLPEYAARPSLRQRFETEAETMAKLDHPNVIRVYDVGTSEALPYMVMELAEGGTLNGWVDTWGPMPPRLACDVTMQVASGLGAAHAQGVVHRDVKPHNVLITSMGVCKVTDFGIARILDQDGLTRTGSTMGTIGYMSPEQRADAKIVDARADVYALGALLYKLLTGVIVTDIFLVEHEPRLLEAVPTPLHEPIVRACYHDRDRRFPDTAALVATLREVRELLPPDPKDTPPLPLPPEDPSLDHAGRQFPEIAELVGPRRRVGGSTPVPPPQDAHGLRPYTMPRRAPRGERSDLPSYVDPPVAPIDAGPLPREVAEALDRTPSITDRAPLPPAAEPAPAPIARWLAVTALAVWILLAVTVLWGSWSVRGHAETALAAREELYRVIQQEHGLLAELPASGVPADRVQPLSERYDLFAAARTEPDRTKAAIAYVTALRAETAPLLRGEDASLTVMRARNLEKAWTTWASAQEAWETAAWWPPGRIAVNLGAAPRP